MALIDKEKLLEELDVRYEHYCDRYVADGCSNGTLLSYLTEVYVIREMVRNQQVIDCGDCVPIMNLKAALYDKDMENRWIPCSERTPKESLDSVIGWDEYRKRCVFVRYYGGRWILGDNESVKIVAWREQPEPYRGE